MLDALMLLAQASPFPTTPTAPPPPGPPPVFVFGVIAVVFLVIEAIWAGICYMLYISLQAVPPEHRKMSPGQIWLLLIPLFNLGWNFVVFQRIPESYQSFFYSRGRTDVGDGGKQIGLWYAICAVCGIVPCLNYIAGPAALVLLIIFLVKVMSLRGQAPQVAAMAYTGSVPGAFPIGGFQQPPFPPPGQPMYPPPPPPPTQG
jgi:hypothetical protein